jgi:hypothetical protein
MSLKSEKPQKNGNIGGVFVNKKTGPDDSGPVRKA